MAKPPMTGTRPRIVVSTDELIYGMEPGTAPAAPVVSVEVVPAAPQQVSRVVFTNQLKPDVYRELRQYEYWAHMELHEILHEAVVAYLADKPEAKQALPPKVAAKRLQRLTRK